MEDLEKEQINIAEKYKVFYETAKSLADDDVKRYKLGKKENLRERMERHLVGMIEMFSMQFSKPNSYEKAWEELEVSLISIKGEPETMKKLSDTISFIALKNEISKFGNFKEIADKVK